MEQRIRIPALVAAVMFLITACAPSTTGPVASDAPLDPRRATLTVGVRQEPQTFDPHVNVAAVSGYRFYGNIYESLLEYGTDGSLKPGLAESWTVSPDNKTYRFKLRSGVKFSDGTAFEASSVKAALERLRTIGKGAVALFAPIDRVDVIDPTTVELVLKAAYSPILAILAGWQGAIFASPEAAKANSKGGDDQGQAWLHNHTAGTGPFMLESWEPNSRIVLTRNPHYREQTARDAIQRVVFAYIAEPSTLRQQLAAGDIDIAEELTPAILEPLRTAKGVTVHADVAHGAGFGQPVLFNLTKKPFDNANLRRAIAYAVNYDRLAAVWNGIAEPAQGFFPNTFTPWFSASDSIQYKQDLTKAAAELRAAGYSMPISPALKFQIFWQAAQTAQRDMAQLMKEDLAKIGIELEILEKEITVWREAIWKKTFDLAFIGLPLRYGDPDSVASLVLISTEFRDRGFNPGIVSKEIDDLIVKGRATADVAQRRPLYNQLQKLVTQDAYILFTVNSKHAWGARSSVTGITWNSNYGPYWRANVIKKSADAR